MCQFLTIQKGEGGIGDALYRFVQDLLGTGKNYTFIQTVIVYKAFDSILLILTTTYAAGTRYKSLINQSDNAGHCILILNFSIQYFGQISQVICVLSSDLENVLKIYHSPWLCICCSLQKTMDQE